MVSSNTKLRLRRRLRRGQKHVESLSSQAGDSIEQHITSRLGRLLHIWRFLAAWTGLLILLGSVVIAQIKGLSRYYQTLEPVSGGIYTEGILGDFTTANPLYATTPVDSAVSRLAFASLFTYNQQNQFVGELASGYSLDATGKVYTVSLKPNLKWQDGASLTANDVVFTYQTIQNPDAQSPLNSSWQNVTVKEIDAHTVSFTLSNQLSSFPYSLTNGIVPAHLLGSIPPDELRTNAFNTAPVGAGPFQWNSLAVAGDTPDSRKEQINFNPFAGYTDGQPKLKQFTIIAFHDESSLINSFNNGEINGIAGLDSIPSQLAKNSNLHVYSLPLMAAEMVFFKTTSGVLADAAVRQALLYATQTRPLLNGLGYAVSPIREPFLNDQLAFNASYVQQTDNALQADSLLQQDGWMVGKNDIRYKANQPLQFSLIAADTQDNRFVTSQLQKQWRSVGVNAQIILQNAVSLQDTLAFHTYDALLYGISIGVDPDVFVYWDSAQATPGATSGLNFSEYNSSAADNSLQAGRIRSDPILRAIKYQPFLQAWQHDAPALGLYQPRFLYLTREPVYGLSEHPINTSTDRFDDVQDWSVRLGAVTD